MTVKINTKRAYPVFNRKLDKKVEIIVKSVIQSNWISSNGILTKNLRNYKKKFNIGFCSSVSSGTTALESAIFSLNLKKGDEVIIPSFTIVSCLNVLIRLGLKPHIIDIDRDTWCLNLSILKKSITKKTKAIIYVHIFGNSSEIDLISKFCKEKKIYLVEDCAESMFTKYKKKLTGTFGDISIFSLYSNKLISSGEGGFIITNKKKLYERVESYKNLFFGKSDRFNHIDLGFNYRLTNLQAAIAWQELKNFKKYKKLNNNIGNTYKKYLNKSKFDFQIISNECDHIFWMVPILFKNDLDIKKVQEKLKVLGIDTRRLFKPLCSLKFIKNIRSSTHFLKMQMTYIKEVFIYPQDMI